MSSPPVVPATGARPLLAVLAPPGPLVARALEHALDGGPALLPLAPDLPAGLRRHLLASLRPTDVLEADGTRSRCRDGVGVSDATALVVATSGSTGAPRGVLLSAEAVRASVHAGLQRLHAHDGRWIACLPTQHVGGLLVLARGLATGRQPTVVARFTPEALARAPGEHVALVPTMLRRLLDADVDLRRFDTILLGGAAAPTALLERARAAGAHVVTTYGLTESTGGCVYDGVPLDGVRVQIDGDGHVVLAGPTLCSGYRDGTTPVTDGRLRTGDLGRLDHLGRLEVLGRGDDVIVTGGENVAANRVEELVAAVPGVRAVAVTSRPDPEWGESVVAVVVPEPGHELDAESVRRAVARRGARHEVPRVVELVAQLPLLPGGKVDRVALRERLR